MRHIKFRKGTLVIEVPNVVANSATDVAFRSSGTEWCLKIVRPDGPPFLAGGSYEQNGADILVSGSEIALLPTWWAQGCVEHAEPWEVVVRLFGPSARTVKAGSD